MNKRERRIIGFLEEELEELLYEWENFEESEIRDRVSKVRDKVGEVNRRG